MQMPFGQSMSASAYLDNVSEAEVFPLFVLDELQSLRLLAAQLGRLFLKLISSCTFELENAHGCQHPSRKQVSCWDNEIKMDRLGSPWPVQHPQSPEQ